MEDPGGGEHETHDALPEQRPPLPGKRSQQLVDAFAPQLVGKLGLQRHDERVQSLIVRQLAANVVAVPINHPPLLEVVLLNEGLTQKEQEEKLRLTEEYGDEIFSERSKFTQFSFSDGVWNKRGLGFTKLLKSRNQAWCAFCCNRKRRPRLSVCSMSSAALPITS